MHVMAKMAKDLQGLAIQIGHLHDGAILLLRPQPFRFPFIFKFGDPSEV